VKTVFILIFFLIFHTLHAQDFFVQVSSVKTKKHVTYIQKKLKDYGFTPHVKTENGVYKIYLGPFLTKAEADKIAQAVFTKFSTPKSSKVMIPIKRIKTKSKNNIKKSNKKEVLTSEIKKTKKSTIEHTAFIGVSAGGAYTHITDSNENSTIVTSDPDVDGLTYELEAGYYLTNNIYATLNYQYTHFDDVNFDNGFSSLNYRFDKLYDVYPYVGVIAGYSRMQWSKNPINSLSSDEESFSFIGGAQIGTEMFILRDLSLYIYYRYLFMEHTTKLQVLSQEKEYIHDSLQNLNVGIKYNF